MEFNQQPNSENTQPKKRLLGDTTAFVLFMICGFAVMGAIVFAGLFSESLINKFWKKDVPATATAVAPVNAKQTMMADSVASATQVSPADSSLTVRKDLVLWLRADALLSLKNNDPVSLVPDGSGKNHNAKQPAAAAQPIFIADGINGKPVLRFDGKGNNFFMGNLAGDAEVSIFTVWAKPTVGGAAYQRIYSSGSRGIDYQSNGLCMICPSEKFGTEKSAPQITHDVPEKKTDLRNFWIGRLNASAIQYFYGDLAEILVYTKKLSPKDEAAVIEYLSKKYSIKFKV